MQTGYKCFKPAGKFASGLFQIVSKEYLYFVEGNDIHAVVKIGMVSTRYNHQLLVVAFQLLEGVFAEVARVGIFAMYQQHGTAYLAGIGKDRHIDE